MGRAGHASRGCPCTDQVEHTDVAVVGVPLTPGRPDRSGARFGPEPRAGVLPPAAAYNPCAELLAVCQPSGGGLLGTSWQPVRHPEAIESIEAAAKELMGTPPRWWIGGDHTIALPRCAPRTRATARRRRRTLMPHLEDAGHRLRRRVHASAIPSPQGVRGGNDPRLAANARGHPRSVTARNTEDDARFGFEIVSATSCAPAWTP
ncbi:hypothetical protein QJS66_12360 [Kocuria rhizophila]|nr:hypothetical protein QJS66_12360 [Kocuria rhizophila]